MSRAGIYARTSKDDANNPRLSIQTQTEACKEKAISDGNEVVGYYADVGKSGTSEKLSRRKSFLKMLSEVESLKIKIIYFLDYSRLSRSGWHLEMFIEELLKKGVEIYPLNDSKEKLVRQFKGILNENYIDACRDRTKIEHESRLKRGQPVGKLPLGYRLNYNLVQDLEQPNKTIKKIVDKSRDICSWIIEPKNAKIIEKIFNMKLENKPLKQISTETGIMIPTLRHILQNKAYLGVYSYNNTILDNNHAPIISKEVFEKCQI